MTTLFDAWGNAMFRASWQGGAALLLVWVICAIFCRAAPGVKCWLWRLGVLKFPVALLVLAQISLPLLSPTREKHETKTLQPARFTELPMKQTPIALNVETTTSPASVPEITNLPPIPHAEQPLLAISAPSPVPAKAVSAALTAPRNLSQILSHILLPTIFAAWLLCVAICIVQLARALMHTRTLRRSAAPANDASLSAICRELAVQLHLRRLPEILITNTNTGPLLAGILRPAILLPASLAVQSRPEQLRLILAHELAHLKRRDIFWNLLQSAIDALFFFHPLIWLARRQSRHLQELACDGLTLAATGAAPAAYGQALLNVLALQQMPRRPLAGVGVADSAHSLRRRLLAMKNFQPAPRRRAFVAALLIAITAALGIPQWRVVAQSTPATPSANRASATTPPSIAPTMTTSSATAEATLDVSGNLPGITINSPRPVSTEVPPDVASILQTHPALQPPNHSVVRLTGDNTYTGEVRLMTNNTYAANNTYTANEKPLTDVQAELSAVDQQMHPTVAPKSNQTPESATPAATDPSKAEDPDKIIAQFIPIRFFGGPQEPERAAALRDQLKQQGAIDSDLKIDAEDLKISADQTSHTLKLTGKAAAVHRLAEIVAFWDGSAIQNPTPADTPHVLQFPASLNAPIVDIQAPLDGTLSAVAAAEGQPVHKGDVLFRFDDRAARAAVETAKIKYNAADSALQAVRTAPDGATVRQVLVQAEADARLAEIQLQFAQHALDDLTIHSPIDGIVQAFYIKPGQFITRGTDLVNVVAADDMRVEFNVPLSALHYLHKGRKLTLLPDQQSPATAEIDYIADTVDPQTNTVRIRGKLISGDSHYTFKSGMNAYVYLTPPPPAK